MASDGLEVGLEEFKRMRKIDKDIIIYNNLICIRKKLGEYKIQKKVQYIWLFLLTIFTGAKKFIGF